MKKIITGIITFLPLVAFSQQPFTITGNGKAFKNGDKIYLAYKVDGVVKADSTLVVNSIFDFKGNITNRVLGHLYKNENPFTSNIVHDSGPLYIEPGNILITSKDSLNNAEITGTKTNVDLTVLNSRLKLLREKLGKTAGDFDALPPQQQKDINVVASLRAHIKEIRKEMEPIEFAFIKSHPDSYISLVTLEGLVNNADLSQIKIAYDGLTPFSKASPLGKDLRKIINSANQTTVGLMAMDFTLPNQDGKLVKLSDFRGKYVLVDFWASWCLPCREENPNILIAYQKYKNKGFTVLGVSIDDQNTKSAWLKAIKEDGLPWTQVLDDVSPADKSKVKNTYGITTIPANVLVDPSGRIIAKNIKDKVLLNKLEELMETSRVNALK
jgi:peroxiredoxin